MANLRTRRNHLKWIIYSTIFFIIPVTLTVHLVPEIPWPLAIGGWLAADFVVFLVVMLVAGLFSTVHKNSAYYRLALNRVVHNKEVRRLLGAPVRPVDSWLAVNGSTRWLYDSDEPSSLPKQRKAVIDFRVKGWQSVGRVSAQLTSTVDRKNDEEKWSVLGIQVETDAGQIINV